MIIWRGALARTGGTVCLKIAEHMLQINGVDYNSVKIDDIFSDNELSLPHDRFGETLIGGSDGYYSPSFKQHPFHVIFVTRDLRDAFASNLKLTKKTFENNLGMLGSLIRLNLKFLDLPHERCLQLHYENDVIDLPNGCRKIARFLELDISEANIVEICQAFSQRAIAKRSEEEEQRFFDAVDHLEIPNDDMFQFTLLANNKTRSISIPNSMYRLTEETGGSFIVEIPDHNQFTFATNTDGSFRLKIESVLGRSKTDGFQQGHVSSKGTNPWKSFFSIDQQEIINREIIKVLKTEPFLPESFINDVLSNDKVFQSLDNFKVMPDLELGRQHHLAGAIFQAEAFYNKSLEANPDNPVTLHLLGLVFHQLGQYDTARDLITKALIIKPDYEHAIESLNLLNE